MTPSSRASKLRKEKTKKGKQRTDIRDEERRETTPSLSGVAKETQTSAGKGEREKKKRKKKAPHRRKQCVWRISRKKKNETEIKTKEQTNNTKYKHNVTVNTRTKETPTHTKREEKKQRRERERERKKTGFVILKGGSGLVECFKSSDVHTSNADPPPPLSARTMAPSDIDLHR